MSNRESVEGGVVGHVHDLDDALGGVDEGEDVVVGGRLGGEVPVGQHFGDGGPCLRSVH